MKFYILWKPDTVYHAAAYKHVPLVEHNLAEVKNMYFNFRTSSRMLKQNKSFHIILSLFQLINHSSTNIMGATKLLRQNSAFNHYLRKNSNEITTFERLDLGYLFESLLDLLSQNLATLKTTTIS